MHIVHKGKIYFTCFTVKELWHSHGHRQINFDTFDTMLLTFMIQVSLHAPPSMHLLACAMHARMPYLLID
jgi:hypothetical protein